MHTLFNKLRLQTKLSLLIGVLFSIPLVFAGVYINRFITKEYYAVYGDRTLEVARFVASTPQVMQELQSPGSIPFIEFSQLLDTLTTVTQVRYIVPFDMEGRRLYHPDHEKIGMPFVGGDEQRALSGESYISSATGTLGFSQRAFVPVCDEKGKQIGVVAVGIMSDAIEKIIAKLSRPLQQVILLCLVLGLALAILLARSIKKILFGLEPGEIATLLQERSAMLHMVKEGVLAVNTRGRVTLVNEAAAKILSAAGITEPLQGTRLPEAIPAKRLFKTMRTGIPEYDDEQRINGVVVLANHMPVNINGVSVGAISTFRDMSEVRTLAERITDIKRYADALRSQSHEFMNRLHVIVGLLNSGKTEDIKSYIEHLVNSNNEESKVIYDAVKDPVIAGFLSSKHSNAREMGLSIRFSATGVVHDLGNSALRHGLITILGNLIDNGLDAMQGQNDVKTWHTIEEPCAAKAVEAEKRFLPQAYRELLITFIVNPETLFICVDDSGDGLTDEQASCIFLRGWSTKGENRGLGLWLVHKTVLSLDGTITVDSVPGKGTRFKVQIPLPDTNRGSGVFLENTGQTL